MGKNAPRAAHAPPLPVKPELWVCGSRGKTIGGSRARPGWPPLAPSVEWGSGRSCEQFTCQGPFFFPNPGALAHTGLPWPPGLLPELA